MAKKARKRTTVSPGVRHPTSSFEELYPKIARWISQERVLSDGFE